MFALEVLGLLLGVAGAEGDEGDECDNYHYYYDDVIAYKLEV